MLRRVRSPVLPSTIAVALIVAALWYARTSSTGESLRAASRFTGVGCAAAATLFRHHQSGQWLTLSGEIEGRLSDTYGRLQHQRFIVDCTDGLHLLIVNDVSIGQRVPVVVHGWVTLRGQYVWDSQGGLVHFTHHANGGGASGWILFRSHVYQ